MPKEKLQQKGYKSKFASVKQDSCSIGYNTKQIEILWYFYYNIKL